MKVFSIANRKIIEPCGLENINYQIDTYVGCEHYCYYCYALNSAENDWRKEISIHENLIERLSNELDQIPPQKIYLGYKTDPYQPLEAEQLQTRKVLELLLSKGFSASILTKSNLVERDIDLLQKMPDSSVSVSVAFTNNEIRQLFEANTMDTELRIDALQKLKQAGVNTSSLICPVIPYITDVEKLISQLSSKANRIWIYSLSMLSKSELSWLNTKKILQEHYPHLSSCIENIVFDKDHDYWKKLRSVIEEIKMSKKLNLEIRV